MLLVFKVEKTNKLILIFRDSDKNNNKHVSRMQTFSYIQISDHLRSI